MKIYYDNPKSSSSYAKQVKKYLAIGLVALLATISIISVVYNITQNSQPSIAISPNSNASTNLVSRGVLELDDDYINEHR